MKACAARLVAIRTAFPSKRLSNSELAAQFPDWPAEKIREKTGIENRFISGDDECASDLAFAAAAKLFQDGICRREEVDFLLLCTQSPDYFLPTTACILHERLKLMPRCGALDFNLGCSGYIYGLGLAKGLIETNQAKNVILITAETYSKFLDENDKSVRTIFGDGAAATLVSADDIGRQSIGPFIYGTDGSGAKDLIVERGGARWRPGPGDAPAVLAPVLHMEGSSVFAFTLNKVPLCITQLLEASGLAMEQIDYFVFHQANAFMLEALRKKIGIPHERFCVVIKDFGNTVSSTIPIALESSLAGGVIKSGSRVALVGFGVGYSWGATLIQF